MKTRKLLLALVLVFVGSLTVSAKLITTNGSKPSLGNGNRNTPYKIWTAEELRWFVHYENTRHWYPNDYAKLMCDIDLSSICGPDKGSWIPLGYSEESGAKPEWFGVLYGNGCKITGLYIDGNDLGGKPAGFCGLVGGGKIADLTIEGAIYNAAGDTGGLIGYNWDRCVTIDNCVSNVDIHFTDKATAVGGLMGHCRGNGDEGCYYITNCTYEGLIEGGDMECCGTLIGLMSGFSCLKACSGYCGYHEIGSGSKYPLPLIGYSNNFFYVRNCISDAYIIGTYVSSVSFKAHLRNNIYTDFGECRTERATPDTEGGTAVRPSAIRSGEACYKMNQMMDGQYFKQTLGTQKVPYASGVGSTVYSVKQYTNCKDYEVTFSNSPEDITTHREHNFADGQATCSNCGAPNPSSHAHDGEYYTLANKEDAKVFWSMVNDYGFTELKVRLTADIDMAGEQLAPLKVFKGEIDGAGHTLSGLNISSNGTVNAGLVGCLEDGGYVHDLAISGNVNAKNVQNVGAFAGQVEAGSTLRSLLSDCRVFAEGDAMEVRVGGIVGLLAGTAERCFNNGAVTSMSGQYSLLTRAYVAGVVGFATSTAKMSLLANGASVGVTYPGTVSCKAIVNYTYLAQTPSGMYYVNDRKNPGYYYFGSSTGNSGETAIAQTAVGSGQLCYLLNDNGATEAFGQTIGTDLVPCLGVSEAHKQVYNTRHYYNCTEYSDYSNSENGEVPLDSHQYNSDGYCTLCNHANVSQDYRRIYQIATAADWNCYAKALNAAYAAHTTARFASAALTADITLDASDFTTIGNLWGNIYGQGHTVTLSNAPAHAYCLIDRLRGTGTLSDLSVQLTGTSGSIISENVGKVSACSAIGGQIYLNNYGFASDCYADQAFAILEDGSGYLTRCLQCTETNGEKTYTMLSKTNGSAECNVKVEFTQDQADSGELAYRISHIDKKQSRVWGQNLGKDSHPKPYYGQTPASSTYVTSLTTYSAEHPDGIVEYINAGVALEAAPGYYKVCQDTESWTARPAYNFIIDKGDGTYTAEHINIDPTVQNYLPMEVQAAKLTFQSADSEGKLVAKDYGFGEILSLVFPVDMPVSNVNGHVHLFDGYDALNNTLVFTSSLDEGDCTIPANTPVLVKTYGGSLLNSDLTDVTVSPMTEAGYSELENVRHLTNYQQQTLPTGKVVEDGAYVLYYVLGGDKATLTTADANTVNQFNAYFRLPYIANSDTQSEINVALVEDRELKTSRIVERDIFDIPYGSIDDSAEWQKVSHLSDTEHPNIFYGNDINKDICANISAYDFLYIHGKAGQKYQFYFNGSTPTEVEIDQDGDAFIDLNEHRVGIGDVYLRGIRLAEGETVADDAFAKVYKYLEEGLVLYGYGDFSDDLKGYPFYDATGVKCGITLRLDNPNAIVVGGPHVMGVKNRIEKSADVMQGFIADSLSLTDGGDFCYDYSVKCPQVTFTRYDVPEGVRYATFVLPFAVKAEKGLHEYIDCDGKNVYFNTPEDGIIDAYLPIVIDMEEYEGNTITITGEDFVALSPNGTFNVTPAPTSQYDMSFGFVKSEQQNVPLTNEEVVDYNVYGFSTKSYKFVRATETFSVSPFRAFFMLPKSTAARAKGFAAPEAEVEALDIVLDGEEITTGIEPLATETKTKTKTKTYNVIGQPVGSDYKGIVIKNNKKTIVK